MLRPEGDVTGSLTNKKREEELILFPLNIKLKGKNYTQPVGLGRPAILQAPLPGPEGKSS